MKIREYIFLASGCVMVGIIITFAVLGICARLGVNIDDNLWVLAIPAVFSVALNITLLEIYRKFRKKK